MRTVGAGLGAVLALLMVAAPVAAEESTVAALAAWQGEGRFYRVAKDRALFVGAFSGILFVESKQGALDAAKLVCPGAMEVNLGTAAQTAEGQCVITTHSGDQVFARWRCTGTHGEGCAGRFELNGGTGRFEQIAGQGDFTIRSAIAELADKVQNESVRETAAGLAVWPSLHYRIP